MCQGNPILRVLGFIFLFIAFIAATVAFFAPFWLRNTRNDPDALNIKDTLLKKVKNKIDEISPNQSTLSTSSSLTTTVAPDEDSVWEPINTRKKRDLVSKGLSSFEDKMHQMVPTVAPDDSYYWEGLWAKCQSNFSCHCMFQDDLAMEKAMPDWFKATQGLYSIGLFLYLLILSIGGFYLCCKCCQDSIKLATSLGSLILSALIIISLALVVFGGFSHLERSAQFEGSEILFDWGYFLAIAAVGPAILASIFYFVDGCRRTIIVKHHAQDDCETAKMV